jgi:predicted PolB exonuclease-like 3'-5' exonuclease
MQYLIFDIETIPLNDLPTELDKEVARRTQREVDKGRFDAEEAESLVRSISPFFGQVIAIGMRLYNADTGEIKDKVIAEDSEINTLQVFLDTINHQASRDLKFVHYNGLNFDAPFILIRAAHYGLSISNTRFTNLRKFAYDNHVDIMQFLSRWGNEGVSLDMACRSFGIPSPKEGEVQGNTVNAAFQAGDMDKVAEYVMRDVEATYQLLLKIVNYLPPGYRGR